MKFLLTIVLSFNIFAASNGLDSIKNLLNNSFEKALSLSNNGYSFNSVYSSKVQNGFKRSIKNAVYDQYTGYSEPSNVEIKIVNSANVQVESIVLNSFANMSTANGAGIILEELSKEVSDLAIKNSFKIYTINHQGAFSGCREIALVDSVNQELLIFGSCWAE